MSPTERSSSILRDIRCGGSNDPLNWTDPLGLSRMRDECMRIGGVQPDDDDFWTEYDTPEGFEPHECGIPRDREIHGGGGVAAPVRVHPLLGAAAVVAATILSSGDGLSLQDKIVLDVMADYGDVGALVSELGDDVWFHYTNWPGASGIIKAGRIQANTAGWVYVTKSLMSPKEVHDRLFLGLDGYEDRGDFMIAFRADPGLRFEQDPSLPYGQAWRHFGSIRLGPDNLLCAGPNPVVG